MLTTVWRLLGERAEVAAQVEVCRNERTQVTKVFARTS
jgi:hypothetical protein